jgi:hypothetical protein
MRLIATEQSMTVPTLFSATVVVFCSSAGRGLSADPNASQFLSSSTSSVARHDRGHAARGPLATSRQGNQARRESRSRPLRSPQ